MTHEWLEIGNRRWCLDCGSFQVRRNGEWRDEMVGPWPGYNRTIASRHAELLTLTHKTETDAMHWMLLQAYLGRSVSITHDGRSVMFQFAGEIDAEQFAKFMSGARP